MELKFDANQEFQLQAIEAVTDLFTGQPRIEATLNFITGQSFFGAIANRLDLNEADLLMNLHTVQDKNNITQDPSLLTLEEKVETTNGIQTVSFYNFSVEMETGTGKTYVYLRTALELYKRYGFRKYIVVVPSVAIREGVLKTLQITRKHLQGLFGSPPYSYYVYDSANLSQVRQFALSDGVEVMVMTIDAFNKSANIIRQTTDRLQGETPVHLIQAVRPILILDEPQNMESEKSIAALSTLNPLLALRYSATHRNPYNVVYRLTPFEAYRQGLVKRIEVASVVKEDDTEQPYIKIESIVTKKNTITARLAVHKLMKSGTIKETVITVKPGDSLQAKTNRVEYAEFDIEEINPGSGFVRFANNIEMTVGQELGADKEAIFEAQIRYTVEEHLRKQARYKDMGMKVLSLFFIDRVDNYAQEDGIIRRLFNQAFNDVKQTYPDWKDIQADDVQAAYFAQRRTRIGQIILEDSKTGESEKDRETYDLIMKDKERLLSLDEPVAFIFSHSALREGWDNPNVFQICTLNQTASDVKKRQEVGRGVRLAVGGTGDRVRDERVNILTVVANQSYENFVTLLQSEIAFEYQGEIEARYGKPIANLSDEERRKIAEEYGKGILPPKPKNARERGLAKLRKAYTLKPEFQTLWEKIKHKTRYNVNVESSKLIEDVENDMRRVVIKAPRITVSKAGVQVSEEDVFKPLQLSGAKTLISLVGRYPLPNLIEIMANLLEFTTPPVSLTRRTLLQIIKHAPDQWQKAALDNPNEFASAVVAVIKSKLLDQLVDGIQYHKISQWYEMTQFEAEIPGWKDHFIKAKSAVYDHINWESDIEKQFVEDLESRQDVKLYLKLPTWFTVCTPVGEYNPDWAIVMEDPDKPTGEPLLYLVRETKDTQNLDKLRPDEKRKIKCGTKHFEELDVDYRVVTSAGELP